MSADLVMITGGSRGIGAALARHWPGGTARVILLSRSAPVEDVGGALRRQVDLATREGIDEAAAIVAEEIAAAPDAGRVVLVHNAATLDPIGFAGEVDQAAATSQAVLNLVAPVALGNAFLAAVAEHPGERSLLQITSGAATGVYPGWSGYGPAKAAVDHWVRHVGEEQRLRAGVARPIGVLAVAPGVVATSMQELIRTADPHDFPAVERFRELHANGALEDPDDVARRLWALVLGDDWQTGDVLDLRDLA